MKDGIARNGDIELAYETFGDEGADPLLLICCAGLPMFGWPDEFCTALAGRSFVVTRFDNRDSGRSTRLGAKAKYTLADMALDDAVGTCRQSDGGGDSERTNGVISGMGHDFPRELWPTIIDEVRAITASADTNGVTDNSR